MDAKPEQGWEDRPAVVGGSTQAGSDPAHTNAGASGSFPLLSKIPRSAGEWWETDWFKQWERAARHEV